MAAVARTKYIRRSKKKVKQRGLGNERPDDTAGIEFQRISLNVFWTLMGPTTRRRMLNSSLSIAVTRLTIQAPAASF